MDPTWMPIDYCPGFSGGQSEYSDQDFADDEFAWKVEMMRAGKLKAAVAAQVLEELLSPYPFLAVRLFRTGGFSKD
jgi:hypothetical protein